MSDLKTEEIINHLWNWITTIKEQELIKDTTRIYSAKYDGYLDSSPTRPLSFTAFELSDKGELIINDTQKLMESQAAFYIFVNTKSGWIVAVKNTLENQKKLIRKEPVQNMKVRIVP